MRLFLQLLVICLIVTISVAGIIFEAGAQQQNQYVSVQEIKLIKPEGFRTADNFPGFQHDQTGASIVVTIIPGPFLEISKGLTKENLPTRGMTLVEKQEIEIQGEQGILLNVKQQHKASGSIFLKWMVVFGNDKKTAFITAAFPEAYKDLLSGQLKNAVLSVKWNEQYTASSNLFDALNFSVDVNSTLLKYAGKVGYSVLFTKSGSLGTINEPFFIVGSSFSAITISDIKQFAVSRLMSTAGIKKVQIKTGNDLNVAGLKSYEIIADAKDEKTGDALLYYQTIIYDNNKTRYFIVQGKVGESEKDKYLSEFRRITSTFKRK